MVAHIETFRWRSILKLTPQFGFRVVDDNGEVVGQGEGYASKSNAERGARNLIETVKKMDEHTEIVFDDKT